MRLVRTTVGRGRSWVVLALTLIVSGLLLAFGGSPTPSTSTGSDLPVDSESAQVRALRASLPSSKVEPAIVVFTRAEGPLTSADLAAVDRVRTAVADEAVGQVRPAQVAPDRAAALVAVPFRRRCPTTRSDPSSSRCAPGSVPSSRWDCGRT